MTTKVRIVNTIPGDKTPRGTYTKFWQDLRTMPKGKFLEVTAPGKTQKLISNHIYYMARKTHKHVRITYRPQAMYAYWK